MGMYNKEKLIKAKVEKIVSLYAAKHAAVRNDLECKDISLTKQSFKDSVDINNILAKYEKTGVIDHINQQVQQYGDVSNIGDYQTALNQVIEAQTMFANLPAQVRKRFGNDPGEFLKFVDDPQNIPEMERMGLIVKKAVADESTGASSQASNSAGGDQGGS